MVGNRDGHMAAYNISQGHYRQLASPRKLSMRKASSATLRDLEYHLRPKSEDDEMRFVTGAAKITGFRVKEQRGS